VRADVADTEEAVLEMATTQLTRPDVALDVVKAAIDI
jgi:hypothetical protein